VPLSFDEEGNGHVRGEAVDWLTYFRRSIQATKRHWIIDCSRRPSDYPFHDGEPEPEQREEVIWSCIDRAFAEPTTRNDDTGDYAATQIIAELFKDAGFGGVAYKSNFGKDGYNIALFDIDAAELINLQLHTVEAIGFKFSDEQRFIREYTDEERNDPEFQEARFIEGRC
jgi:RES domain